MLGRGWNKGQLRASTLVLINLPKLWAEANLTERRKLLMAMVDAVYFETKKLKSIVAIKPKPPFRPVFQVAASKAGSDIRIVNEPYEGSSVFLVETGESQSRPETQLKSTSLLPNSMAYVWRNCASSLAPV